MMGYERCDSEEFNISYVSGIKIVEAFIWPLKLVKNITLWNRLGPPSGQSTTTKPDMRYFRPIEAPMKIAANVTGALNARTEKADMP